MDGWDWVWAIAASSAGSAALLTIGAFLARSQLSHWLNKDLERAKAAHQRELEAYKVTLIAESERAKARQEVKKAGALRLLERRIAAIHELHQSISGLTSDLLSTGGTSNCVGAQKRFQSITERIDRRSKASHAYWIYMSSSERAMFAEAGIVILEAYQLCQPGLVPDPSKDAALRPHLLRNELLCEELVRSHLSALEALD